MSKTVTTTTVRGQPKSGRFWKSVQNERYSAIKKDKAFKSSWQEKMEKKNALKKLKEEKGEMKKKIDETREVKRIAEGERKKRKLENERKAEVVVPITNLKKLKKTRKKHLRTIEKR